MLFTAGGRVGILEDGQHRLFDEMVKSGRRGKGTPLHSTRVAVDAHHVFFAGGADSHF